MAEILEFQEEKRRLAAKRGFQNWNRRFSGSFNGGTSLRDLSDDTLKSLIKGGEESSAPLYEFAMGVMGLGVGQRFYFLETQDKMLVMDIALFLLDQLRFEAMRRLGWVDDYITFHIPLVDLVEGFPSRFAKIKNQSPPLSPSHPQYKEFLDTFEGDRGAFVRRMIPEVIRLFGAESEGGPNE